jgi:hypothetical protein
MYLCIYVEFFKAQRGFFVAFDFPLPHPESCNDYSLVLGVIASCSFFLIEDRTSRDFGSS